MPRSEQSILKPLIPWADSVAQQMESASSRQTGPVELVFVLDRNRRVPLRGRVMSWCSRCGFCFYLCCLCGCFVGFVGLCLGSPEGGKPQNRK